MRTRLPIVGLLALGLCHCAREAPDPGAENVPVAQPSVRDGKGAATVSPSDPVPARSRGSWTFTFTVGEGGIPAGGGVAFQVSPFWGWSRPHNLDPDVAGYCSVTASSKSAKLETSCNTDRYYLLALVHEGRLEPGETLTVIYGDTQGGAHSGAAAKTDLYAERQQEFLFKTDGDGDGTYGEIPRQPHLRVTPREAVQLWVNAPSIVSPGEQFEVSVAALDRMGNRAVGYEGTVLLEVRPDAATVEPQYLMGGRERGAVRVPVSCRQSGLFVVAAHTADGLSASSNPILCGSGERFPEVCWGDIHGHSFLSDGTAHPDDYYAYARDVAGLDVASLTDHDAFGLRPLRGDPWSSCVAAADSFYEPGRFVTLLGYEWTSWTYGHRNVYFPGGAGEVYAYTDSATTTPEGLWGVLRLWGAISVAHHVGGGPIATDWDHEPPADVEMLVEAFSVHGNSERYGGRGMIYSPVEGRFVQDALARGYRLGIIASGDGHIGHPGRWTPDYTQGLVAFQTGEKTREAVWEALVSRRVYGTSGARILLQFTVNGYPMGSVIPTREMGVPRVIEIRVLGTAAVDKVEVVKNNETIEAFACDGVLGNFSFADRSKGRPDDYYYARVTQADGHLAWSSPIWLGSDE